jgi:hypothetical protein
MQFPWYTVSLVFTLFCKPLFGRMMQLFSPTSPTSNKLALKGLFVSYVTNEELTSETCI